jgi:hypothetical protein
MKHHRARRISFANVREYRPIVEFRADFDAPELAASTPTNQPAESAFDDGE